MIFTKQDLNNLDKFINNHDQSGFVGYLKIVYFGYKTLNGKFDKDFFSELKLLIYTIHEFPDDLQRFFYLCAMNYYARVGNKEKYIENEKVMKTLSSQKWKGLCAMNKILLDLSCHSYSEFSKHFSCCENILCLENNKKRLKQLKLYNPIYYVHMGEFDEAIALYEEIKDEYNNEKDYTNYGVIENNIGWIYNLKKEYSKAIIHYENAVKYLNHSNIYFDLAWCYYCNHQIELSRKTIYKGKIALPVTQYHLVLLEWLELMIDKPYSKRCLSYLLNVYDNYIDTLSQDMKKFVYIALINQYKKMNEHEKAYDLISQLFLGVSYSNIELK